MSLVENFKYKFRNECFRIEKGVDWIDYHEAIVDRYRTLKFSFAFRPKGNMIEYDNLI